MRTIHHQAVSNQAVVMPTADALFGKARMAALAALFVDPGRGLHLREIARRGNVSPAAMSRELESLLAAGALVEERQGNLRLFRVNSASALAKPLCDLARAFLIQSPPSANSSPALVFSAKSSTTQSNVRAKSVQRKSSRVGLSAPHDWPNSAMLDEALITRTASSLNFGDVVKLCARYGLAEVRRVIESRIADPLARTVLTRQLKNIEVVQHANETAA